MDTTLITKKYRRNAYVYDFAAQVFSQIRSQAIGVLGLKGGETVLDFGCGTGLSFDGIEQGIGAAGKLIGVDLSPAMLAKARQKITRSGWENVILVQADAEEVDLPPESVDAVLSFYTHDIMSSRQAVERAKRALRPGGRFVIAGTRRVGGGRGWLLDPITLAYAQRAITQPLTTQPWKQLEDLLGPLKVEEHLVGTAYIAYGVKAA